MRSPTSWPFWSLLALPPSPVLSTSSTAERFRPPERLHTQRRPPSAIDYLHVPDHRHDARAFHLASRSCSAEFLANELIDPIPSRPSLAAARRDRSPTSRAEATVDGLHRSRDHRRRRARQERGVVGDLARTDVPLD